MYQQEKYPCVYIMASEKNGTTYIGVTSNLIARIYQHKHGTFEGFTSEYGITNLVYYELYETMTEAINREKQMKKWNRAWKLRIIEEKNPNWGDLFHELF